MCLSVYYQIFYLLYLFINAYLLVLWLKGLLNLHINLFTYSMIIYTKMTE